jgi:hypothetical protein
MRRHLPIRTDESAVGVDLISILDNGRIDQEIREFGGNKQLKSIPGEALVTGISLLGPATVGVKKGPSGVVKIRVSPGGVVAGVKAPEAVEGDDWQAVFVQVEGLSHCARAKVQREESREYEQFSHLGSGSW